MPLFNLFVPYSVRTQLLQSLSAYDAAKLDIVFPGFLDPREKNLFLNPLRDLVWDVNEVRALEAYGMRLLLLGNDVMALQERLHYPRSYIKKHGHSRKLRIYLTGYCPVLAKTTQIRDRMVGFSVNSTPSAYSMFEDTVQIRNIKSRITYEGLSPDTNFTMSFGASIESSAHRSFWLQVPETLDATVDLRIYVPSFKDREWGKVYFPSREALRLSRCVLRRAWLLSCFTDVLRMCFNIRIISVAYLSSSGLHPVLYGRLWLESQIYM
ncbi:hypothetical protein CC86DRAFT_435067 [Ophiobolus disseminans]|uniref:Uncharacterized protein n=1 Tax=Ophiobolus disseminans TaxID=1469910 RepID=A0A6A6ZB20_9PLEO|nr:hypothetical protein CC86DRAFT_435067 [Ophiobolus disseminans]